MAVMAAAALGVWPTPRSVTLGEGLLAVGDGFSFAGAVEAVGSARLTRAAQRYDGYLARSGNGAGAVSVQVASMSEEVGMKTRYDYEVVVNASGVAVSAGSIYGAMYAMETMVQFARQHGGLPHMTLSDSPMYDWRGLMVDTGRRFFPLPLLKNLLDTMAGVKMNVLHIHASDYCRFSIESKLYPNLTAALTGIMGGHYTQDDIKELIQYASDRGIRVVPEFDIPGHSRGFLPLESEGVEFCTANADRCQLYNDPKNSTMNVLKKLFKEMSGLFTDEVFNIGCDETAKKGSCTTDSTFSIEREMQRYIAEDLGKTPAGWEELLFNAGAAQSNSIVDAWSRHTPGEITATGRRAIESSGAHFYFTRAVPGGPDGWKNCWYNISETVAAGQGHLLLGGEVSMWSDTYCYISQCKEPSAAKPVGSVLFSPEYDTQFGESIGGMIWPRGYVAAGAFWNFNATTDPTSTDFTNAIWAQNDELISRGSMACPSKCSCDQLTACEKPYISSE